MSDADVLQSQIVIRPFQPQTDSIEDLIRRVEELAVQDGAAELALDTAEGAHHLIRYYSARGYRFVDYVQWNDTNYRSVLMSKRLSDPSAG